VVGDPAGVEARPLCGHGHVSEPLCIERLAVVRQDHAKMQTRHAHTLSPDHAKQGSQAMNAKEWVAAYAEQLAVEPPTAAEFTAILDLAAEAAHASDRLAAPVACWLAAKAGRALDESLALARGMTPPET
jgi:hypothetical protein